MAGQSLTNAVKCLHSSGKYSDMIITCNEKSYRVHKAIICPQSGFFTKACNELLKVGTIELKDDDPEAVRLMVHYFYHQDYPYVEVSKGSSNDTSSPGTAHVKREEKTIQPPPLIPKTDGAGSASNTLFGSSTVPSSAFSASSSAQNGPKGQQSSIFSSPFAQETSIFSTAVGSAATTPAQDPNLVIHAKMYALGVKYNITGLLEVALDKFCLEAKQHWNTQQFVEAAEITYTIPRIWFGSILSGNRLRYHVAATIVDHKDNMLRQTNVRKCLQDTPSLAYQVLMQQNGCKW